MLSIKEYVNMLITEIKLQSPKIESEQYRHLRNRIGLLLTEFQEYTIRDPWKRIAEEKPKENTIYLVIGNAGIIYEAIFSNGSFKNQGMSLGAVEYYMERPYDPILEANNEKD